MPSDPLTDDELRAIRERCDAATKGPWAVKRRYSNDLEIVPRITCAPDDDRGCGWIADLIGAPYLGNKTTIPNANFMAGARTDVPRLLAEIDRLKSIHISDVQEWVEADIALEVAGVKMFDDYSRTHDHASAVRELAAERDRLKSDNAIAWQRNSELAGKVGELEGTLKAIGWQGGVDKVVAGFREENERMRAELAALK